MGRQAYLDKIAFGRSAFEPTQSATQSTDYIQLESSQSELPRPYQEATANSYIQLYDERGNPINPRSREYGKKLRDSQNDVLASVGVVERRRSPSEGLPGSYAEHLLLLEAEDTVGNAIALTSTLTENLCTWWLGTIRDRVLTFRYQNDVSFIHIVASEWATSGKSIIYTGFAPRLFSTMSMQAIVYSVFTFRPIDRILRAMHASPKIRYFFRQWKDSLMTGCRLALEVLFYPFSYHASLQRLGLIPTSPLLPSWASLMPFSNSSPLLPFSSQYDASASIVGCLKATLTCPVVFVCMEHFIERWVYSAVYEAVESSVIRPDNADMQSRDAGSKDRATQILGLRRQSPPLIRDAVNKLLRVLGWGQPFASQSTERKAFNESVHTLDSNEGRDLDIGTTSRVTNLTPLELAVTRSHDQLGTEPSIAELTIPIDVLDGMAQPTTPPSPTASIPDDEDNDPRIRITNREGIVEMEVRLPPRILSSHTEVEDTSALLRHHHLASRNPLSTLTNRSYHRVTQLSSEPAQMISAVVKAQIVGLALLPIRLVVLRLVASHYLAAQPGYAGLSRVVKPFPSLSDLSWRCIGFQVSRIALCGALELTIDLGLWGMQYLAITRLGKYIFGWGTL
ncbi:Nn.00g097780.m01.CDS01 [Neocucurbitaria sp. VM-36]